MIRALCVLLAASCLADQPNIVFILADDLGYGDVSACNPNAKVRTPHMDRLATEGARFTQAYAAAAVCVPSRYSLLTGRYPFRGDLNWRKKPTIPEGQITVASVLQDAGYHTACVGKWHCGFDNGVNNPDRELAGGPLDRGFDSFFGQHGSLDQPPYFYIRDRRAVQLPTEKTKDQFETGFSIKYQGRYLRAGDIAPNFDHDETLDRYADEAVAVLEKQAKSDQPFFLYFPLTAPHGPWGPSDAFKGKSALGSYGDFLMHTDAVVGRILAALDRLGQTKNTLVILSSDNGPLWSDDDSIRTGHNASGGFRGRKGDVWDGGVHMPFMARLPGKIPAGSVRTELLVLTDMLATLAAVGGATLAPGSEGDSINQWPTMQGKGAQRESLLLQSSRRKHAVRMGDWKYIPWLGGGGFLSGKPFDDAKPGQANAQLYDLAKDPGESRNLHDAHPERVEALATLLKKLNPKK